MTKAVVVKRRRGRPLKEESTAIAMDKAVLDLKSGIASLVPEALITLRTLLTSGSDKVKEGTAKFIIQEAKEAHAAYIEEDNDAEDKAESVGGTFVSNSSANVMPLTTEIREYKVVNEDD